MIFGDGANISFTPLFENAAMGNHILDARISLLPVYISLAVETDRLVYVFNDFVIGECQQMSTQKVATCTRARPVSIPLCTSQHTALTHTSNVSKEAAAIPESEEAAAAIATFAMPMAIGVYG